MNLMQQQIDQLKRELADAVLERDKALDKAARLSTELVEAYERVKAAEAYYNFQHDYAIGRKRPQDECLDGAGWTFKTSEHGGAEPDTMPQVIVATDPDGVSWVYIPMGL